MYVEVQSVSCHTKRMSKSQNSSQKFVLCLRFQIEVKKREISTGFSFISLNIFKIFERLRASTSYFLKAIEIVTKKNCFLNSNPEHVVVASLLLNVHGNNLEYCVN